MPPKKMRGTLTLTTEVEFMLIQEIEKRPLLWDTTLNEYRQTNLKAKAFEEVAEVLGTSHNCIITGEDVADRWKSMKSTFAENERRVREWKNKNSGSGADDIYIPKWKYYNRLLFLKKTAAQAPSVSNLNSVLTENSQQGQELPSIYYDDNLRAFVSLPLDSNSLVEQEQSISSNDVTVLSPGPSSAGSAFSDSDCAVFGPVSCPTSNDKNSRNTHRASSASSSAKSSPALPCFENRGQKTKVNTMNLLEKAVNLMSDVASQPLPDVTSDTAELFGSFVAARLREIEVQKGISHRRECEANIITTLARF